MASSPVDSIPRPSKGFVNHTGLGVWWDALNLRQRALHKMDVHMREIHEHAQELQWLQKDFRNLRSFLHLIFRNYTLLQDH